MKNIALSFSGGGFRAAAYSLGCLSYLNYLEYNNKPLLQRVSFISSTSGGSIANLVYSHHLYKGKDFKTFYSFLKSKLAGDDLLKNALSILNDDAKWKDRPEKSRNIINAFSLAYESLFEGESFEVFNDTSNTPHVKEICVNATEFTNGLSFRFHSQNPDLTSHGQIGNGHIHYNDSGLDKALSIKLSDILAASSCFPSGFEPMIFPRDFANSKVPGRSLMEGLSYKANEFTLDPYNHLSLLSDKEFRSELEFGLMDGGVADNQAIDAFMLAEDRVKKGEQRFDLLICCDVTSYLMDGYSLPLQKKYLLDFISIRALIVLAVLAALWLPAMVVWDRGIWQPWQYITGTLSSIPVAAFLYIGYKRLKSLFGKKVPDSTWTKTFGKHKGQLLRLSLGAVRKMIAARFKSVFILANDIYLKQIRRQYYDALFSTAKYRERTIQNTIYDLSRAKISFSGKQPVPAPTTAIVDMAEKSRTMATTLWFDQHHIDNQVLSAIIATGQFTTCYNLIRHINKRHDDGKATAEELAMLGQLMQDWQKFCTEPDFLVN
jgi:predicted acylesterase/phospholipase RssA